MILEIVERVGIENAEKLLHSRFQGLLLFLLPAIGLRVLPGELPPLFGNGQQPYTDAQLTKALVLAGVEPEKTNLQASRTVKGGQTATAATAGLGVVEAIQQTIDPARDALVGLVPYLEVAKWLLLAVTLVGIGIMLWARIDDHRRGLR